MKSDELTKTMRTAFLTAYPKIFTNIEYASDIFAKSIQLSSEHGFFFKPSLFVVDMAVEIEARYKALSSLLSERITDDCVVIDLASGLSPRRIAFEDVNYYESDLPPIVKIKKQVYNELNFSKFIAGVLSVDLADIDSFNCFLDSIPCIQKYKKIIFLSEGLFWYLKRNHVQQMINCVKNKFSKVGFEWITADCPVQHYVDIPYRNKIADSSDKSPVEPFSDYNDYYHFFTSNDFDILRYKLIEYISPEDIFSGKVLSITKSEIITRMNSYTDLAVIKRMS